VDLRERCAVSLNNDAADRKSTSRASDPVHRLAALGPRVGLRTLHSHLLWRRGGPLAIPDFSSGSPTGIEQLLAAEFADRGAVAFIEGSPR
jgi:hypothetical protein